MKAAIILQYSQAEGLPYCFTLNSHFLQMVLVFPLLPTSESMHTYISNNPTIKETFYILPFLLELWTAICAFDDGKSTSAFLGKRKTRARWWESNSWQHISYYFYFFATVRYLTSQSIISFSLHSQITHTPCTIVDPVIIPRKDGDWNNGNKRIMLTWFCSFWYGVVENPQQKPEVYQLSYFNTRLFYIESIYYTRQKIFLVLTSTYNGHWKIIQ